MKQHVYSRLLHSLVFIFAVFVSTAFAARIVDFDTSATDPSYSWRLAGTGNDVTMAMTVNNLGIEELVLNLRAGTVFAPSGSNVQRMLLRTDLVVRIPSGQSRTQSLPVLCMDIRKDPPSTSDCSWNIRRDTDMAKFLDFTGTLASQLAEEIRTRGERIPLAQDDLRHQIERYSVWRYNGASQEDIGKFLSDYGKDTDSNAHAAMLTQMADLVIQMYRAQ